jgi:hypothetical protein
LLKLLLEVDNEDGRKKLQSGRIQDLMHRGIRFSGKRKSQQNVPTLSTRRDRTNLPDSSNRKIVSRPLKKQRSKNRRFRNKRPRVRSGASVARVRCDNELAPEDDERAISKNCQDNFPANRAPFPKQPPPIPLQIDELDHKKKNVVQQDSRRPRSGGNALAASPVITIVEYGQRPSAERNKHGAAGRQWGPVKRSNSHYQPLSSSQVHHAHIRPQLTSKLFLDSRKQ